MKASFSVFFVFFVLICLPFSEIIQVLYVWLQLETMTKSRITLERMD